MPSNAGETTSHGDALRLFGQLGVGLDGGDVLTGVVDRLDGYAGAFGNAAKGAGSRSGTTGTCPDFGRVFLRL